MSELSNTFRGKLKRREFLFGTFIKTPHPHVIEALGPDTLDVACLDAEHAPFDRRDLDACVLAGRAVDLPLLIRPQSNDPARILDALDIGAQGILAPHVTSGESAAALVNACRYRSGGRGFAASTRAAGYGRVSMQDHISVSNESISVVAQIEDVEALDHLDKIVRTEGLDAIFIGRTDLTVSLGASSPKDAVVMDAVTEIVRLSAEAGMAVGMFTPDNSEIAHWRALGSSFFLLGSDHSFMRAGAAALKREVAPTVGS
jgi:staphyloferrin B biosynthesis citrate synthase